MEGVVKHFEYNTCVWKYHYKSPYITTTNYQKCFLIKKNDREVK
jgi:hypothetical protein